MSGLTVRLFFNWSNIVCRRMFVLLNLVAMLFLLTACAYEDDSQTRINVDAVEKALKEIQVDDQQGWMDAFEKRVNEIYEGDGIVSVDSRMEGDMLKITGYVEKNSEDGLQPADEEIFSIKQTSPANEKSTEAVITSNTANGSPVEHHTSFLNTMFQYWLIHKLISPSHAYHTPGASLAGLSYFRDNYRRSSSWTEQRRMNTAYNKRRPAIQLGGTTSHSGIVLKKAASTGSKLSRSTYRRRSKR